MPSWSNPLVIFCENKNIFVFVGRNLQKRPSVVICVPRLSPEFTNLLKLLLLKPPKLSECVSVYFKRPIVGGIQNCFMLTAMVRNSRHFFSFSCFRMDARSVIACLFKLLSLFKFHII